MVGMFVGRFGRARVFVPFVDIRVFAQRNQRYLYPLPHGRGYEVRTLDLDDGGVSIRAGEVP